MADYDYNAHQSGSEDASESSGPETTVFTAEDIYTAWKVICPNGLDQSVLTKSQLLESLRQFFPNISAREIKDVVGTGNFTIEKLKNLLIFNQDVPEFDANVEAFKLLDPHGTGYISGTHLARLILQLPGIGYIDDDDMRAIMSVADPDQDGQISLKDFSTLSSYIPEELAALSAKSKNSLLPGGKK